MTTMTMDQQDVDPRSRVRAYRIDPQTLEGLFTGRVTMLEVPADATIVHLSTEYRAVDGTVLLLVMQSSQFDPVVPGTMAPEGFSIVCQYSAAGFVARPVALPFAQWHEDQHSVLWWKFPINEPPDVGTPLSSDWPFGATEESDLFWTPLLSPTAAWSFPTGGGDAKG